MFKNNSKDSSKFPRAQSHITSTLYAISRRAIIQEFNALPLHEIFKGKSNPFLYIKKYKPRNRKS